VSRRLRLLVGITSLIGVCLSVIMLTAVTAVVFHDNQCDPGGARTRAIQRDPVLAISAPSGVRSSLHVSAPHSDLLLPGCQQGLVEIRFRGSLDPAYAELHAGIEEAGWSLGGDESQLVDTVLRSAYFTKMIAGVPYTLDLDRFASGLGIFITIPAAG